MRRIVDAADVQVPDGYEVEPIVVGLSFPTALCFADDGTPFLRRRRQHMADAAVHAGADLAAREIRHARGHLCGEPRRPAQTRDGLMYFGQGSVGLQGVVTPAGFTVDLAMHLYVHDVPGPDALQLGRPSLRAIGEDPDRIWHTRNARRPAGQVQAPEWFGYPDLCGGGLPAWHEKHQPIQVVRVDLQANRHER